MSQRQANHGRLAAGQKPVTRKERRIAERQAAHHHVHNRQNNRVPRMSIAAGTLVVLVALAVFGYFVLQSGQSQASTPPGLTNPKTLLPADTLLATGTLAPDFKLRDAGGKSFTLSSQRGHTTVLEFFAVWCPVCHREAPTIHQLAATYRARGVRFLAIMANPYGQNYEVSGGSDTRLADKADLSWYAATYKSNYPLLVDPNFATVNRYGAAAYPTIYVIDRSGKITYDGSKYQPYDSLSKEVNKALHS